MKKLHTVLAVAFLSTSLLGGGALALAQDQDHHDQDHHDQDHHTDVHAPHGERMTSLRARMAVQWSPGRAVLIGQRSLKLQVQHTLFLRSPLYCPAAFR